MCHVMQTTSDESDGDDEQRQSKKRLRKDEEGKSQFIAHVPVPTQEEVRHCERDIEMHSRTRITVVLFQIEEALIERKKRELMERYASDELQSESKHVEEMLGVS